MVLLLTIKDNFQQLRPLAGWMCVCVMCVSACPYMCQCVFMCMCIIICETNKGRYCCIATFLTVS